MTTHVATKSEISVRWFKENPERGIEHLLKFYRDHPPESWSVTATQQRAGFLELIAKMRPAGEPSK